MSSIHFAVSAKTARLIGRENISGVDGAIIELIKNAYDADADCVYVLFDMPFPDIPNKISYQIYTSVFNEPDRICLMDYYKDNGKELEKIDNIVETQEQDLASLLYSKNSITIMDNGYGMDENTLRCAWMNIGTSNKEEKRVSPQGRIKTGAKGIGRFALDKLSTATTVYTKSDNDVLKKWNIDWEQFEIASLLDEVTATIDNYDGTFYQVAQHSAKGRFKAFENYKWETGTIIRLSPTRDVWSSGLFAKLNINLKSLFPSTNNSKFDIYVTNLYYPQYSFDNERFYLNESEYDYKIIGIYDGDNKISVKLTRNEIETRKQKTLIKIDDDTQISVSLSDFWQRDTFQKSNYRRSDYAKTILREFDAVKLTKLDSNVLKSVGAFEVELYFIKNAPSPIDIVKPVIASIRKNIINNFSGIKLYRDGFKVRPYGEEDGPSYDWLSLGLRAQRSPAAVSHISGSWRVRLNQIIGAVRITRDGNPNLMDMANREGLAINSEYHAFKKIIEKIIETFEADRQTVFKEFAAWTKDIIDSASKTSDIIDQAKKNAKSKQPDKKTEVGEKGVEGNNKQYTQKDLERALLEVSQAKEGQERANKTMMLYSSAGVMTNTFSHEISRIMTQMGSRMQHLRYAVKLLIKDEYKGNPLFNPYTLISENESVDKLLEKWLDVIMAGAKSDAYKKTNTKIVDMLSNIVNLWVPLLEKKLIKVAPIQVNGDAGMYVI